MEWAGTQMESPLDTVLRALERDARLSPSALAAKTGLSEDEVLRQIAEAEEREMIISWGARINWESLGLSTIYALVEVSLEPQDNLGYNGLARRISRFDEARTVYFVSGAYDLLVMVEAPSMGKISDFISDRLATMPGVKGTTTHILMRRFKEDGVMLEGKDESARRSVVL